MAPHFASIESNTSMHARPTLLELQGESGNHFARYARSTWLDRKSSRPVKISPEKLKSELWDPLESDGFNPFSLLILNDLQCLESYLWPGYTEDSSNFHVLLICLMVNIKRKEDVPSWECFSGRSSDFSSLFRRILSMCVDFSIPANIRSHLLIFMINAFQSLDNGLLRKECAPLVSISIWNHLSSDSLRVARLEQHVQLKKAWRASVKRFDAADDAAKAKLRFDRSWLFTMTLDFFSRLSSASNNQADNELYCERFIELLVDLESQLPTRRYVNALLHDLNILPVIKQSRVFKDDANASLRDLHGLLHHYALFSIDDHTGAQLSDVESYDVHCRKLAKLQRTALKHFMPKLEDLVLSNYSTIDQRAALAKHFSILSETELRGLSILLDLRVAYPKSAAVLINRAFLLELLISAHERLQNFKEAVKELSICPTEESLFQRSLLRNEVYDGSRPLALPKLNLQYLTVGDFLWRSFILHRCEAFFEIRKEMEEVLKRLQPQAGQSNEVTRFGGFSKMALPISKPTILDVSPPRAGEAAPAQVHAEVTLNVSRLKDNIRGEWEALRPGDVVFLLAVRPHDAETMLLDNGPRASAAKLGLVHLRTAEVVQVLDETGRSLRAVPDPRKNGHHGGENSGTRKLIINIDPATYRADHELKMKGKADIFEAVNLIVRRRGRENNFKPILESIRSLTLSEVPVPAWLQEVFLGYGDPAGASYTSLPNRLTKIDFRDTFLSWEHLRDSQQGKDIRSADESAAELAPPFILETESHPPTPALPAKSSKKRARERVGEKDPELDIVRVSSYRPSNTGPYPADTPKLNQVRFTPAQIEAITSGTQPGLTVIVGPPGTGKTDVAVQIISNIYHNFPRQRTLLLAHSNQALNQLFQKIIALEIDERHLLRLGHGEEDLATDTSYSKHGRVESFLDKRSAYLAEVDRLAANLNAPGAHGNSCETAAYFDTVYVQPAWNRYLDILNSPSSSTSDLVALFPFHDFFSSAPQPLFPAELSRSTAVEIASGCHHHIRRIFSELADIRPFELLRNSRERANYLLLKEARIIAMTSTHAAMRRQEIEGLGFHYDNIITEEAAQMTEIETFLPFALQRPKNGVLQLKRFVLVGDHLQNSPIVQNLAFRRYANLEQSLFLRLIRLGVPAINLDRQGRARAQLADLYRWRYRDLGDLPLIREAPEYQRSNAGFQYEYQFIDVPDYKGTGESEPTPHFLQNLGEAEYAVAIYQYMRLLGYPASKISILATYAGQRALIRDVLGHRCARHPLFGLPRAVATVDQYQGEQNDYIILSLTRTSRVGYLRDLRRLTVALSRARLGLYILGRRAVFETCHELREAFAKLFEREDALMLVTGETYGAMERTSEDKIEGTVMEGVEHLGRYVYEMTQARVTALNEGSGRSVTLMDVVEVETSGTVDPVVQSGEGEDEDGEESEEV